MMLKFEAVLKHRVTFFNVVDSFSQDSILVQHHVTEAFSTHLLCDAHYFLTLFFIFSVTSSKPLKFLSLHKHFPNS